MIKKFRYWDSFNGVMVYSDNFKNLSEFFRNYQLAIDGENNPILEQFTGLKDKNGVGIYEGDIIKYGALFVVEWDQYFCRFHRKSLSLKSGGMLQVFPLCEIEVKEIIGNIHQNKELLK